MAFGKSGTWLRVLRLEDRVTPSTAAPVPVRPVPPPPTAQAAAAATPARTTTTELTGPTSATERETVTFTAKVRAVGSSVFPTGSVTFRDGTTVLGTVDLRYDKATISTSALSPGTHSITATFNANADYSTSRSPAVSIDVAPLTFATATSLSASATAITVGQSLTLTAMVRAVGDPRFPIGTVTFKDGTTVLGTADLRYDKATFTTSALGAGTHSITAVFNATLTYRTSASSAVALNVTRPRTATTTALTGPGAITRGQTATFVATVRGATGTATPSGTVTFRDGTTVLATVALSGGRATFSTSQLAIATHAITATYNAAGDFTGSVSTALSVRVSNPSVASRTTVSVSRGASTYGDAVTFTARVSPASGTGAPTGTVTFKDGSVILGTKSLSGGAATLTIRTLKPGSHTITAVYSGDSRYTTSNGTASRLTVIRATAVADVTVSPTTLSVSGSITVRVHVHGMDSTTIPSGRVTFRKGSMVLGSANLDRNGMASYTFSASRLGRGQFLISGFYEGSDAFNADGGSDLVTIQ